MLKQIDKNIIIIFFLVQSIVSAQSFNFTAIDSVKVNSSKKEILKRELKYDNIGIISSLSLAGGIVFHNQQSKYFWQPRNNKFSINNKFSRNNYMGKFGRFYSTNLIAHFYSAGLEGANLDYELATIYSAVIGFGYGFYTESMDGFTRNEGFDFTDISINFLASMFVLGQYYIPELKNIQPRFSYYPSQEKRNNKSTNILNDNAGQKYWLAIRVKKFLPELVSKYWPSFLMIALGAGVSSNNNGENEFFVSLDFDAEKIPLYGTFWQFIKNTLNYFHFPLPGIRISQNSVGFLFCY